MYVCGVICIVRAAAATSDLVKGLTEENEEVTSEGQGGGSIGMIVVVEGIG